MYFMDRCSKLFPLWLGPRALISVSSTGVIRVGRLQNTDGLGFRKAKFASSPFHYASRVSFSLNSQCLHRSRVISMFVSSDPVIPPSGIFLRK